MLEIVEMDWRKPELCLFQQAVVGKNLSGFAVGMVETSGYPYPDWLSLASEAQVEVSMRVVKEKYP